MWVEGGRVRCTGNPVGLHPGACEVHTNAPCRSHNEEEATVRRGSQANRSENSEIHMFFGERGEIRSSEEGNGKVRGHGGDPTKGVCGGREEGEGKSVWVLSLQPVLVAIDSLRIA